MTNILRDVWESLKDFPKHPILEGVFLLVEILLWVIAYYFMTLSTNAAEGMTRPGFSNPFEHVGVLITTRIGFLLFTFILFLFGNSGSFTVINIGFTLVLYIISCTPDPPSKSKIKEWFESIKAWFEPEPMPSPA